MPLEIQRLAFPEMERASGSSICWKSRMHQPSSANFRPQADARFSPTQWTVILQAGQPGEARDQALEKICQTYWYPIYAFVRRRGQSAEDAQDLTQEFFARLTTRDWLAGVGRDHGARFSTLLLTMLKHFLADQHDRATALKRGGGVPCIPLDFAQAEAWFGREPSHGETPERVFERRWAWAVLDQVIQRLATEAGQAGKGERFEVLRPFLSVSAGVGDYGEAAARLGISAHVVAVAVQRLRLRFRAALREELAAGVTGPSQVEEEVRHLLAALR